VAANIQVERNGPTQTNSLLYDDPDDPPWLLNSRLAVLVNATDSAPIAMAPNVSRVRIAIPQTIAPINVAYARATRTAAINATGAGIMAINELATFFVVLSGVIPITTGCVSPNTRRAITVNAI
jgi:hypothetical protein